MWLYLVVNLASPSLSKNLNDMALYQTLQRLNLSLLNFSFNLKTCVTMFEILFHKHGTFLNNYELKHFRR